MFSKVWSQDLPSLLTWCHHIVLAVLGRKLQHFPRQLQHPWEALEFEMLTLGGFLQHWRISELELQSKRRPQVKEQWSKEKPEIGLWSRQRTVFLDPIYIESQKSQKHWVSSSNQVGWVRGTTWLCRTQLASAEKIFFWNNDWMFQTLGILIGTCIFLSNSVNGQFGKAKHNFQFKHKRQKD